MGFNHAAAFIAAPAGDYIKPFKPWFEGPVTGFKTSTQEADDLFKQSAKVVESWLDHSAVSKIKPLLYPNAKEAEKIAMFHLRAAWLEAFLTRVGEFNTSVDTGWAVEWTEKNQAFPKTADALRESMLSGDVRMIAAVCVTHWREKP